MDRAVVTRARMRPGVAQLLLVCAPAGFGKRALLADWVRTEAVTRAWQLGVIP
jgi:ATP/maltotriose-dependent transcriptional regulator MalT